MQPTTPDPSAQPPSDATPPEASSDAVEPTSEPAPWWRRLWRGRGADEGVETDTETTPPQPTSTTISLTQEELDRKIQAETDRREAKRAAQALADRKRKLRDEDPWAYAEEDRKAEQSQSANQQVGDLFANIGREHDKYTLDPLLASVPQAEQQRILALEGAGAGLDGRKLIVTEALKSLEKHWKAEGARDAEARLRKNSAFKKQLLAEMRGQTREPEFLPSGNGSSESDRNVSDILRSQLGSRRSL